MQFRFKILTLAIVLIVVAGGLAGVWLSTATSAKADNGTAKVAVQKTAAAGAPAAKADDDADKEEVEGDDKEEENGKGEGKDDEQEVKVTLEQVPAAVRTAILAAAGNNAIEEIEAETENGKTTYEAEWVANGKETETEGGRRRHRPEDEGQGRQGQGGKRKTTTEPLGTAAGATAAALPGVFRTA